MTGKKLFCVRATITLFCYLTPCQPLTSRTDDLYTQLCIRPMLIFKLPQDHIYRGLKIIIIQNL